MLVERTRVTRHWLLSEETPAYTIRLGFCCCRSVNAMYHYCT